MKLPLYSVGILVAIVVIVATGVITCLFKSGNSNRIGDVHFLIPVVLVHEYPGQSTCRFWWPQC